MSQAVHSDPDRRVQPNRAFERYIWTNPGICNNCFRRVKTLHQGPTKTLGDEQTTIEETERTDAAVWGIDKIVHDEYGALATRPSRTTCKACGSVGLNADPQTLSRREALTRLDRLVERCREAKLPVAVDLMRKVVRKAKSRPSLQDHRDREIFAVAVEASIRHHR